VAVALAVEVATMPKQIAAGPTREISVAAAPERAGPIAKALFGEVDGSDVTLYTLTNKNGLVMKVMTYGAIITELHVPDKAERSADIVLGFENLDGYLKAISYFFGATVGRVGNRIRDARFELDGKEYKLAGNDKPHHLHGGNKGWDKVVWDAEASETADGPSIQFTYVSKDGEEGYPGTVTAHVVYTLTKRNELKIEMEASTDQKTPINMVHHSYWNLGGHGSGPITEHELTLNADEYTPGDPTVPTGASKPVKDTAFDFTQPKLIGRDLGETGADPVGFDHNFVVNGEPNEIRMVAKLKDPKSGRVMTLEADQPGLQFYSGNFLDGKTKGKGVVHAQYTGLCLETQKFPNSINVPAWSKQVILEPGKTYEHTMIHRFTNE
jgi:aldose 1-epimerase